VSGTWEDKQTVVKELQLDVRMPEEDRKAEGELAPQNMSSQDWMRAASPPHPHPPSLLKQLKAERRVITGWSIL
jgi:hypothetical protein